MGGNFGASQGVALLDPRCHRQGLISSQRSRWCSPCRTWTTKTASWEGLSRMRSKGSRFTQGVWGLRLCSRDVAQLSATVRNRPQPSAWGLWPCLCLSSAKRITFGGFQRSFVLLGRRGTSWHSDVFGNVSRVVLCSRLAQYFATFSEDALHFSWQAQYFPDHSRPSSSFCVAGAALETCHVACFLRTALSGLRQVVTRCKFRGRRGICEMCWKLTNASHETSILS